MNDKPDKPAGEKRSPVLALALALLLPPVAAFLISDFGLGIIIMGVLTLTCCFGSSFWMFPRNTVAAVLAGFPFFCF